QPTTRIRSRHGFEPCQSLLMRRRKYMPEYTCLRCGSRLQHASPALGLCPQCNATAIAKPEHARQAKLTAPNEQACFERLSLPKRSLQTSTNDDPWPSILRQYHFSTLRFCIYHLLWTAAVFACL